MAKFELNVLAFGKAGYFLSRLFHSRVIPFEETSIYQTWSTDDKSLRWWEGGRGKCFVKKGRKRKKEEEEIFENHETTDNSVNAGCNPNRRCIYAGLCY